MPKTATAKPASWFDVHPGVAMVQTWIVELKPKTSRTLDEWVVDPRTLKDGGPG